LERTLRLLHPFMPFITEEVWQNLLARLPRQENLPESIMIAPYPTADGARHDTKAEEEIALVMQAIRAVRNTRAQLHIPANQYLPAIVEADGMQSTIQEEAEVIRALSRVDPLQVVASGSQTAGQAQGINLLVNPLVVRLLLEGIVDLSAEGQRLREELDGCLKNLARVETLVSNPDFRSKARAEVVQKEEDRLAELKDQVQRLEEILGQLEG
jgi:valyl-tRNA synthetase